MVTLLAGHTGRDPRTGRMADDLESQTRQTLENLKATLEAAGSSFDSALKVNIYLTDINLRPQVNQIYLEYMPADRPARWLPAGRCADRHGAAHRPHGASSGAAHRPSGTTSDAA